jgi:uncharacterized protein YbaP (TraB family)
MRRLAPCVLVAAALTTAPAGAQSTARHFLWSVKHAGAPTSYLMGSVHVLTPEYYPLSPAIEQAFAGAKILITEADLDELTNPATVLAVAQRAMLTDGRTLDQVVGADLYKKVLARAEKAGLPAVAIQRMKPWMVAVSLTAPVLRAEGFDAELGIDRYFFDKSKKRGMERRALETVMYQFERFDEMPLPLQEKLLASVIEDLDAQLTDVKGIASAWSRGDTATIARLLQGSLLESPQLYERLLAERNRNWVAPVESCLLTKTPCFIVVGAAHLVGPDSLVALLQKKGYDVQQQ